MTALPTYVLRCNGPSCDAEFIAGLVSSQGHPRRAALARTAASGRGWTHCHEPRTTGGRMHSVDYCPKCSAMRKEEAA